MHRRAISIIVLALVAAGCGGSDEGPLAAPGTTATTAAGMSGGSGGPSFESGTGSTPTTSVPATAAATTAATPPPPTTMPPIDTGTRDAPLPAGVPVTVGNWQVTVLSSTPDASEAILAESSFNEPPAAGHRYTMVQVAATYEGEESENPFLGLGFAVVGASAVAHSYEAGCGLVPDPLPTLKDVFPGGTVTGNLCWSIPDSDAGTLVLIAESAFSLKDERFFLEIPAAGITFEAPPSAGVISPGGPAGSRGNPVPSGEGALVGSWEVAVVAATPDATDVVTAENSFNDPPAPDHQFFIVEIRATNRGIGSETAFSVLTFSAVGPSSVAYDFEDGCGVIPDPFPEFDEVFAGGTVTGNLCWSVTSDDAAALVLVADAAFSIEDERVFFEIP